MNRLSRFIPKSLRYQLLVRSLFILAGILLLIGMLQYLFMKDFVYENEAESMRAQISSIPMELYHELDDDFPGMMPERGYPDGRPRRPLLFLPDSAIAAIDREGTFTDINEENGAVSPKLSSEEYEQLLSDKANLRGYQVVKGEDGRQYLVVFQRMQQRGMEPLLLQMSIDTAPLQDVLMRQLSIYAALGAVALLTGLMLTMPVIRRTLNPLSRIVQAVQRTDAGNLSERLPIDQGQVEIDRLAVSINGMLERLETSFEAEREAKERMRRFIADASHELRTPLTSINGFLEVLLRGAAARPEQLHSALSSMHGESQRIIKLVEDLLLLAKLDRAPQLKLDERRIDTLLREMEPQLRVLAGTRELTLRLEENTTAAVNADKLKQLVLNLYHNAVQHTDPERGAIELILSRSQGAVELVIKDNGAGIPPEHLPHVFERFYRSESSRTRASGGAGLGLAITQSIVEAHGGSIHAESEPGAGTSFFVKLSI